MASATRRFTIPARAASRCTSSGKEESSGEDPGPMVSIFCRRNHPYRELLQIFHWPISRYLRLGGMTAGPRLDRRGKSLQRARIDLQRRRNSGDLTSQAPAAVGAWGERSLLMAGEAGPDLLRKHFAGRAKLLEPGETSIHRHGEKCDDGGAFQDIRRVRRGKSLDDGRTQR